VIGEDSDISIYYFVSNAIIVNNNGNNIESTIKIAITVLKALLIFFPIAFFDFIRRY